MISHLTIHSMAVLHSSYFHPVLRSWQSSSVPLVDSFIYPIFVTDDPDAKEVIPSLPEQYRWGVNRLKEALDPHIINGLKTVLIFGVPQNSIKDSIGSSADSDDNPAVLAVQKLRQLYPDLLIACDVCLCPYTDHGHCGNNKTHW
jgi:porphobilinogen synthase